MIIFRVIKKNNWIRITIPIWKEEGNQILNMHFTTYFENLEFFEPFVSAFNGTINVPTQSFGTKQFYTCLVCKTKACTSLSIGYIRQFATSVSNKSEYASNKPPYQFYRTSVEITVSSYPYIIKSWIRSVTKLSPFKWRPVVHELWRIQR